MVACRYLARTDDAVSNWQLEQLEHHELRERLVRAATVEHRLHLHAAAERDSERRWRERADLASARGLADLAAEALQRADAHRQRASDLGAAFTRQRATVERLRRAIRYPGLALPRSAASPTSPSAEADLDVEQRLAQLERESHLEGDLAELRKRRATARQPPER
jgi:phage shock protein A